ncbi:cold-inducible protein YdjO-related protein [Paenibacillus terrigena]|uniref:cold-inducible protein YdjO-related protein n=1 Tax=Paenibacillus terrigena TaxID=369333 RepID=UPI0028D34441|nr:cold-inducible protein YdjO-related protein [Paenibacillus terrigena]
MRRVRAWLCTDAGCPAWMRMNPREAADPAAASKACPLCKGPMAPGERQVPARD